MLVEMNTEFSSTESILDEYFIFCCPFSSTLFPQAFFCEKAQKKSAVHHPTTGSQRADTFSS